MSGGNTPSHREAALAVLRSSFCGYADTSSFICTVSASSSGAVDEPTTGLACSRGSSPLSILRWVPPWPEPGALEELMLCAPSFSRRSGQSCNTPKKKNTKPATRLIRRTSTERSSRAPMGVVMAAAAATKKPQDRYRQTSSQDRYSMSGMFDNGTRLAYKTAFRRRESGISPTAPASVHRV